jgi:uridine kinase
VDSDTEELIFRRLVRDQQRVNEPLYMIVSMLGKVFPMWNIFGNPQKKNADLIVDNSYEILEKD